MSVELVIRKRTDQNHYVVAISLEQWSDTDLKLMQAYGEPTIDVGGDFDDSTTSFSLDTNMVRLLRDFPISQRFDATELEDAEAQRDLYADTITDRIVSALAVLRARDTLVGSRTITTI